MLEDKIWVEKTWRKILKKLEAECARMGEKIPYIAVGGSYVEDRFLTDPYWWTNGFWGGILWQLYIVSGDMKFRRMAERVEEKLDICLEGFEGLHHDVGFMWLHTAVADYRITKNERSRIRGLHAANLLAGRYNPRGKFIRSWNENHVGWVIIDSMMNIPLLYWAAGEIRDERYFYIAEEHADTVLKNHVRPDGSCNHIVLLDNQTGDFVDNPRGQGYRPGSAWSRGQAWGLYGFALSFRYTKEGRYLEAAKRIAHYFLANLALRDYIAPADFRAPAEPEKLDMTAAAIGASGLLEIASLVPETEKELYREGALRILQTMDQRFANWNPEEDSIITHGTASYHLDQGDTEMPIIYGDYFFIEAILKLSGKNPDMW